MSSGDGADPSPAAVRRKLLVYTHALSGGGAERVCAILAGGFARDGWDVVLAVDSESRANRAFLHEAVRVIALGGGHGRAVLRLAALLTREKPDISLSAIGVSNVKHTLAAALSGRLRHAVLSYHAFAVSEPQRLSQSSFWLAGLLTRLTARTVAVSHALRDDLIGRWHASARRTVTIYNPVRVGAELSPLPRQLGQRPIVLAAGRLVPDKNMSGLIRAFAGIAAETDAELVILGEGPARAALEAEIAARGLGGRIRLPGYVEAPWALYRSAACFVTASLVESFSMVVAEALTYGLPVVAFDSAGPREVLENGLYGTLVPCGDETALGHAILQALASPGDAALRRAGAKAFSFEAGLAAYKSLFAEIAAGHRVPARGRRPLRPHRVL